MVSRQNPNKTMNCALCGFPYNHLFLKMKDPGGISDEEFILVKCNRCGLVYLDPMPSSTDVQAYYNEKYFETSTIGKSANDIYRLQLAKAILKIKPPKGKALDVGCGDGSLLLMMKRLGWTVFGIDVSESAVKLAQSKLGTKNVFNCSLIQCTFPSSFFDVISFRHVLEHLHKPLDELIEVKRILKKDGIISITAPNIDSIYFRIFKKNWYHLDIPKHLYQFSSKTLEKLLEKAGFKVIKRGKSLEDPLDLFKDLQRLFGIQKGVVPNFLVPALIVLFFMSLPFSYLLSAMNRGSSIQLFGVLK